MSDAQQFVSAAYKSAFLQNIEIMTIHCVTLRLMAMTTAVTLRPGFHYPS